MDSHYCQVVGPRDECARHGKDHMHCFKTPSGPADDDDYTVIIIDDHIWVCSECAGPEYFKAIQDHCEQVTG